MFIWFHVQLWIVLCLTWATVTHAMPRARGRGRGKRARDVHAHSRGVRDDDGSAFEAWDASYRTKSINRVGNRTRKHVADDIKQTSSVMARDWLEAWGFGLKSALVVQKEAAMAVADGAEHEDLIMLASLGHAVHHSDVGPMMCVVHVYSCTGTFAHDVPCTQRRGKCAHTSNVRSCADLSISQGYMVPQQPGNVARDLNRRVAAMTQGVLHDIPISSISIPLLINKGPRQGHGQLNPCASARFPA